MPGICLIDESLAQEKWCQGMLQEFNMFTFQCPGMFLGTAWYVNTEAAKSLLFYTLWMTPETQLAKDELCRKLMCS